jgi:hypothetical protein
MLITMKLLNIILSGILPNVVIMLIVIKLITDRVTMIIVIKPVNVILCDTPLNAVILGNIRLTVVKKSVFYREQVRCVSLCLLTAVFVISVIILAVIVFIAFALIINILFNILLNVVFLSSTMLSHFNVSLCSLSLSQVLLQLVFWHH